MKNKTKQNNKQPTKITKNRITAFLLALLLVTTVLSPAIPVKAQEITVESADIAENNSSGGGHEVPDCDATINFTYEYNSEKNASYNSEITSFVNKEGSIVLRTAKYSKDNYENGYVVLMSNKPFSVEQRILMITDTDETTLTTRDMNASKSSNNVYYMFLHTYSGSTATTSHNYKPSINSVTLPQEYSGFDALIAYLSANVDFSKDDYMSEDDIANMKPVRDPSIGYLPRVRYFDNRKKNSSLNTVTSTIQWDSFVEPYSTDLKNPYYVEIYVKLHYKLGSEKNPYIVKSSQFKKYGEIKYVSERLEFSYYNAIDTYLSSIGAHFYLPAENPNVNPDMRVISRYVSDYYVRLVHYDYEKQQVLCGGFTKITPNENGGCTTETGDFPDNTPNDDDDFVSDGDDPDEWDDTGWEPNPNPDDPDNPDTPDFGIDTSSIGAFIVSAITSFLNAFKSILSLVGEFPELCKHVFSFLPEEISTLMFGGVAAIIIMRFLGR